MALVFAAVVPHTPMLIPAIAKGHQGIFSDLAAVLTDVMLDLYASKPDLVVVLTPHGQMNPEAIVLHVHEKFQGDLREFGDLSVTFNAPGAPVDAQHIKESAERHQVPIVLQSDEGLDYGTVVPMSFYPQQPFPVSLLPIRVGSHPPEAVLRFGRALQEYAHHTNRRLALIASADLAPDPQQKLAARKPTPIERKISSALLKNDAAQATSASGQAEMCGAGPIAAFLGTMHGIHASGEMRYFAAPLGVGELVATFTLGA